MKTTAKYCALILLIINLLLFLPATIFAASSANINVPILCYHNFNQTKPGSMNLTPEKFETQIKWLKTNGFNVIPLKQVVAYLKGEKDTLPPKSIVITIDDGWRSQYKYIYPIAKKYNVPITLFIYPQTISEGRNAMTWDELRELQKTGLFDIEGHTYGHPNFRHEKHIRSAEGYEKFVEMQLQDSKKIIEDKLGTKVTLLAWPYGIYNNYLEQAASKAGYDMAFSIDTRTASKNRPTMAQPRYMIIQKQSMKKFESIVSHAS